ncbi:hypothetical protein, conserved, partial [Eimeria tenella]
IPLDENSLFFIVASDGVWEFISSEEAVSIVSSYVTGSPTDGKKMKDAADRLAYEAFRRWIDEEGNVVDDVTVIVVWVASQVGHGCCCAPEVCLDELAVEQQVLQQQQQREGPVAAAAKAKNICFCCWLQPAVKK